MSDPVSESAAVEQVAQWLFSMHCRRRRVTPPRGWDQMPDTAPAKRENRTDAVLLLDVLGLEQVGWHAKNPNRYCPAGSALWDCVSDKADYSPVYRMGGVG